jgi:hypothetical protein
VASLNLTQLPIRRLFLLDPSGNNIIPGNLSVNGNSIIMGSTNTGTTVRIQGNANNILRFQISSTNPSLIGTYFMNGSTDVGRLVFQNSHSYVGPLSLDTVSTITPITVRQMTANFASETRRLTLLDRDGNTTIPGNIINTNLDNRFSAKANTIHTHAINDVTNLQTELNNKADINHIHPEPPTLHRFTDRILQHASQYRSLHNFTITQNVFLSMRQIQISVIPISNTPISYADLEYEITCSALFNAFRMIVRLIAFVVDNVCHVVLLEAEYFDDVNEIVLDGVRNDSGQLMLNFAIPPGLGFSRTITCRVSGFSTHNPSFNLTPGGTEILIQRYPTSEVYLFQSLVRQAIRTSSNMIDLLYPVGSFYINTTNITNPAILFGRGTWQRQTGLLWCTPASDGNTTFSTNVSTSGGGNLPGYRVYGWRRTG